MVDVLASCRCGSRYVEWFDCEKHGYTNDSVECYKLSCYTCGHDDYDCEEQATEREMANVQD